MEYLFFCHCSCLLDLLQRENGRCAYKCPLCSTTSNGSKVIQHHIAVVHGGKKEYACEICQKQFGFLQNMQIHIAEVHERKNKYPCEICHKEFSQLRHMKRHQVGRCPGKPTKFYSCEICQKQFSFLPNKKRHLKSGTCSGKTKVKPLKEVIEDIKNIQPVVEMKPIKIPKKVNASADNFCSSI